MRIVSHKFLNSWLLGIAALAVPAGETYTVPRGCAEDRATAAFAMPGASQGSPVTPAARSHVNA